MLTPEKRAELRTQAEDTHYVIMVKRSVVLALLDAADERDRLAAAIERVRSFATDERDKISRTYIEQPDTAYAGYANAMDDVIRTIESEEQR